MRRDRPGVLPGVLVISSALVAGCHGGTSPAGSGPPAQYLSVTEVRDALDRSGLGCADFQMVDREHRDIGATDAQEVATCRVENADATIMMWLRLGQAQDWAHSTQPLECRLSQSLGDSPPAYVDGGRWVVALRSGPVAADIAKAIGGRAIFPNCASQD